jgi:hypothetical protein
MQNKPIKEIQTLCEFTKKKKRQNNKKKTLQKLRVETDTMDVENS